MQGDFPIVRPLAVLEEIDTLPGQGKLTIINETHRFIRKWFWGEVSTLATPASGFCCLTLLTV
jgi:hypothetical protein